MLSFPALPGKVAGVVLIALGLLKGASLFTGSFDNSVDPIIGINTKTVIQIFVPCELAVGCLLLLSPKSVLSNTMLSILGAGFLCYRVGYNINGQTGACPCLGGHHKLWLPLYAENALLCALAVYFFTVGALNIYAHRLKFELQSKRSTSKSVDTDLQPVTVTK